MTRKLMRWIFMDGLTWRAWSAKKASGVSGRTLGPYPSGCGPQSSLNPKVRLLRVAGFVDTAAAAELAAATAL